MGAVLRWDAAPMSLSRGDVRSTLAGNPPAPRSARHSMAAGVVKEGRDLSICVHGEVRGLVENRPVARTHGERERRVLVSLVQVEVVPKREPSRKGRLSRVKR